MTKLNSVVFSLLLVLMPPNSVGRVAPVQQPTVQQPTVHYRASVLQSHHKLQEPPERGIPDGRKPFGTRGPCEESDRPFTPLLPLPNPEFSGNTLAERPTFWFYIPYASDRVRSGQFVLSDANGDLLYGTNFTLPTTPGFVSVKLPESAPVLSPNQSYRWEATLYCATETSRDSDDLVSHTGWITRISDPNLVTQLSAATPQDRINLYSDNNLWYDAANELHHVSPASTDGTAVLQQLGLESLQDEAIAGPVILLANE